MAIARNWEKERCQAAECQLSIWNAHSKFCIFHDPNHSSFSGSLQSKVNSYLISNANNPGKDTLFKRDALELYDLALTKELLEGFRGVSRPLLFCRCQFLDNGFFVDNTFNDTICFDLCEFIEDSKNQVSFYQLEFKKGVQFHDFEHNLVLEECTIYGHSFFSNSELVSGKAAIKFDRCSLKGENRCQLRCGTDVILKACFGLVDVDIVADGKSIMVVGGIYNEEVFIHIDRASQVDLQRPVVHKELRLKAELSNVYANPSITLIGVSQINGAKIAFQNLNLSSVHSTDFVFQDAILANVNFDVVEETNRPGFESESNYYAGSLVFDTKTDEIQFIQVLRESYKNLKIYYDRIGDYQTANAFHSGELWAQWHIHKIQLGKKKAAISWHGLYWLISDFGQSWTRPLAWIGGVFFVSAIVFATAGLKSAYLPWEPYHAHVPLEAQVEGLTLAFRNLTPWFKPFWHSNSVDFPGNLIAAVSFLQSSITLIAGLFFILALRRRFKR